MNDTLLNFNTRSVEYLYEKESRNFLNKYSIIAMDDGESLMAQFDIFDKTTMETLVEIYINRVGSFVVLHLRKHQTQVTIKPLPQDEY